VALDARGLQRARSPGLLLRPERDGRPHRWVAMFLLTVVTMLAAGLLPAGGNESRIRWGRCGTNRSLVLGFGENHGRFSE